MFLSGKLAASAVYDSEYDNYGPSSLASESDLYDGGEIAASKLIGSEDKIRRVSQHITRSFGQTNRDTIDSHDA